jgi:hypothetical protein
MKLRVASNPGQFPLAQDTFRRTIRFLEWNLILSHLVDSPTLAGMLFHPSNMHRISSKCPLDYDTASCPSMKARTNPLPVTIDALVGACCPPIQGWCRHDESHFLRALWTKQHPRVSNDCLVRLVSCIDMMNSLPSGKTMRMIRLGRWPSRVCIKLLTSLARSTGKQRY